MPPPSLPPEARRDGREGHRQRARSRHDAGGVEHPTARRRRWLEALPLAPKASEEVDDLWELVASGLHAQGQSDPGCSEAETRPFS